LHRTQSPALYPAFIVSTIAFSVILTWVYNSTGGSLLMVVLLHATVNLPLSVSNNLGTQAMVPVFLYFGLEIVVAIVVVIWAGPKHLSRKHRKQEEQGAAEPGVATPPGVVKPTPA
jgi:membrane protease YdiL (CAAX protease family)